MLVAGVRPTLLTLCHVVHMQADVPTSNQAHEIHTSDEISFRYVQVALKAASAVVTTTLVAGAGAAGAVMYCKARGVQRITAVME